jgi:small multidrug resistance pump
MKGLILILGIAANALASVLVKIAILPPRKFPSLSVPLNVAHPVLTAGAVATVALFSVLIFREHFYWTTGTGFVLVIVGVALITARVA